MPKSPEEIANRRLAQEESRSRLQARCRNIEGPFFDRLKKCGLPMNLLCRNCLDGRAVFTRCKWKCCPVCQPALVAASARRFAKIAKSMTWPLLATFSAEHEVSDGVLHFREMRSALVKLRDQVWFKARVKGGVCAWEVSRLGKRERKKRKLGKDRGWHFHCHALIDCRWLFISTLPPKATASKSDRDARIKLISRELDSQWSMAMGGRKGSIHVRRVWLDKNGGIDGAVHEVLKYALSGADLAESDYDIEPVLWALEKTRMVAGFGSMYRHPDIKRELRAPAMCSCGCSSWCPEEFHESTFALTTARNNRGRK